MKKQIIISLTGIFLGLFSTAQNEVDALRYSQITFGGTARYNAMGGAFGALGGDISTLSTNPAGIAIYRKSEFTFTPSFYNQTTTSSHYNNTAVDGKYNFNFGNVGFVGTFKTKSSNNTTGWINTNFGIAYNRLNNFHSRVSIEGVNNQTSLLDVYIDKTSTNGGIDYTNLSNYPFDLNLAWMTYLIDTLGGATNYISAIPNAGELQSKTIFTKGSVGETVFSFGGNYANKLYLGATLGFANLRYIENATYKEMVAQDDSLTPLNSFTFNENFKTTGNGFNFKFGMIYRINDFIRVGGAIHTPTFYTMTDSWDSDMQSKFNTGEPIDASSPKGKFNYSLNTPFRAIGSAAFIFNKKGLISVDYEFVDYTSAKLSSIDYNFNDENAAIRDKYSTTQNIRIGTEWRSAPFSFRGGFALYGNPYNSSFNNDGTRTTYSLGFGIREQGYFIDFGYRLTRASEDYYLYNPDFIEPTTIDRNSHSFLITVGFRY